MTGLSVPHATFVDEYLKDGNAVRAYMVAYPAAKAKSAASHAHRLVENGGVAAELARRRADVAARNGITLDMLINVLKIQAFTPISEVLGDPRDIEGDKVLAVESYRAATAQTAEVTKIADRRGAVLELWDRLFPGQGKAPETTTVTVNATQINIDAVMRALTDPLPPPRVIDVRPERE